MYVSLQADGSHDLAWNYPLSMRSKRITARLGLHIVWVRPCACGCICLFGTTVWEKLAVEYFPSLSFYVS